MKMIWKYLKPVSRMMFVGLLIKVIGSVLELMLPYILSKIIDDIVPLKNTVLIAEWGVIMILCSILAWWCNIRANRSAAEVSRRATRAIRHDLFEKTLYLSCEKTDHDGCFWSRAWTLRRQTGLPGYCTTMPGSSTGS